MRARLLLALCSLLLASAAAVEALARWHVPAAASPLSEAPLRWRVVDHARPVLEPGTATRGGLVYRIGEHGYRGAPPEQGGCVVYGGSAVFDMYADAGQDWPTQAGCANAGIPGHDATDSATRLLTEGRTWRPSVVVLYNAWNDIKGWTTPGPRLRHAPSPLGGDPRLVWHGPLDRALSVSRGYLLLRDIHLSRGLDGEGGGGKALARSYGRAGLEQYAASVRAFVDIARAADAVPILMLQLRHPTGTEPSGRTRYDRAGLEHAALVQAFAETDRALRRVASETGALLVDPTAHNGSDDHLSDHVHTTAAGSAALASTLRAALAHVRGES